MLISIGGALVSSMGLFAINMQLFPEPWIWPLLLLTGVGFFFESSLTPVALAYLADITEGSVYNRGTVMGLYSVFLAVGQILGANLGAPFISALGFNGLLLCTLLLLVISVIAVLNLRYTIGD